MLLIILINFSEKNKSKKKRLKRRIIEKLITSWWNSRETIFYPRSCKCISADRDSLLSRCCACEESFAGDRVSGESWADVPKAKINYPTRELSERAEDSMTKRGERDRCATVRLFSGLRRVAAKVGCYLTILVKTFAALYNRPRSRGVTERHGSWALPSQSQRLPSLRRADMPFRPLRLL